MSHPGSGVETPLPKFYPTIMAKKINTEEKPQTVTDDTLQHEAAETTGAPSETTTEHSETTHDRIEESAPKPEKPAQENHPGAQTPDAHVLGLLKKYPAYPSLYIDAHGGTFSPNTAAAIRGKAVLYRNPFYHESKNKS